MVCIYLMALQSALVYDRSDKSQSVPLWLVKLCASSEERKLDCLTQTLTVVWAFFFFFLL